MEIFRRRRRMQMTTSSSVVGAIVIAAAAAACTADRSESGTRAPTVVSPGDADPIAPSRFSVQVVDAEDGVPLPGARVHAQIGWFEVLGTFWGVDRKEPEVIVVADASGVANWEMRVHPRPGPSAGVTDDFGCFMGPGVTYFAESDGHQTSTPKSFDRDPADGDVAARLPLKAAATVAGRVVDAETGAAVAGARVVARKVFEMWDGGRDLQCGSTMTDVAGAYRLTTLFPDARLVLEVTSDGYGPGVVEIRSGHARSTAAAVDVRLARPAIVEGSVRTDAGEPVTGAKVVATSRSLDDIRGFYRRLPFPMRWTVDPAAETETLADGSFRLPGVAKGARYTVYVIASTRTESTPESDAAIPTERLRSTYVEDHVSFAVGEAIGGGARVDLVVARFPRVFVRLTDENGVALAGPLDVVSWIDGQGAYGSIADASGWAEVAPELGGLGLGRRRIAIDVRSYRRASFDVELKPNDVVRRDVALDRR
jgi:hypothetical protein